MAEVDDNDTRRMVEAIRKRVESEGIAEWIPTASARARVSTEVGPMRHHSSLDYLHKNWALRDALPPPSLRRAIRGGPRAFIRAVTQRAVLSALSPYLDANQELIAHIVRLNDAMAKRCDHFIEEDDVRVAQMRADLIDLAAHVEAALNRLTRHAEPGSQSANGA